MAAERWTDEMLDKLAEKVDRIADEIEQTNNNVDALVGAVNSLVTVLREDIATIKSGQQETAKIQAESIRELIKLIKKSNPE